MPPPTWHRLLDRCNPLAPGNGAAACLLVVALLAISTAPDLGPSMPLTSHEIFVARSATEMEVRGDWLIPYFNGEPRLQKPPLNAWLAALGHRMSGATASRVTELESRLPSFLCAVGLVLVAYALGREISGDQRIAVLAAAITATSLGTQRYADSARPEMAYTFFTGIAILALTRLRNTLDSGARRTDGWLLWGAVGAAVLTKGPFLPVFVLLGAAVALVGEGRWRSLGRLLRPKHALPLLGLVAAMFVVAAQRTHGALELWRSQMFDRVSESGSGGGKHLVSAFYLYATPLLTIPWVALLPLALGARFFRALDAPAAVPGLWWMGVLPALLLSFSAGKHEFYMLPALAPFYALMAWAFVGIADRLSRGTVARHVMTAGIAVHALAAAVGAAALAAITLVPGIRLPFGLTGTPSWTGFAFAVLGLGASIAAAVTAARRPVGALLAFGIAAACGFTALAESDVGHDPARVSGRDFGLAVRTTLGGGRELVSHETDANPVIYYGERNVPSLALEDLRKRAEANPDLVVIARQNLIDRGILSGTPILVERTTEDPRVLLSDIAVTARARARK
jgi:4-amino-4-deoxy-L-arabinose transferase-like glycosyltransferase